MDAKVPLPVSFSEFSKEPVKAILFIALLAIGYLYVDSRIDKNNMIENQGKKIEVLEQRIESLTEQLIQTNILMAEATAELRALKSIKQ
jgi:hypothetical protein